MTHLTPREKLLVLTSAILTLVWVLFAYTIKPAMARIETLSRVIPEKQSQLERLCAKSREYSFLRGQLDYWREEVASQNQAVELLPFLESLIQQCGLTKKVATMRPLELPLDPNYYEVIVEIRLENLTLRQMVDLLRRIEELPRREGSSKILAKIKSLHIKTNPMNTHLLDSTVEIHTARLIQSQIAYR